MSDSNPEPQAPTTTIPITPPPPNPPAKHFTQEELNEIAAREKDQGKRSAEKSILDKTGFESVEALAEFAKQAKADQDAKLSEAERKAKEADERERDTKAKAEETAKLWTAVLVKSALVDAGVSADNAADIARMVDVEPTESDEKKIKDKVGDLKKKMPQLFEGKQGAPGSHPAGGGKQPPAANPDPTARATELVHRRHPNTLKNKS